MNLSIANTMEIPKPSHWPMSMARFGKNPMGENIYRVVFAPTVRKLVFGQFSDGYIGARLRKSYPAIGNKWIIEKWISGFEDTRMTPAEYEKWGPRDPQSGMLINGPYPYNGTYNECHTFEFENPQAGSIEKIIALVEKARYNDPIANRIAMRDEDERKEKADAEQRFLRVRELEPLYGARPASIGGRPKAVNHKTQNTALTANELGLPTANNKVVARQGPIIHASI